MADRDWSKELAKIDKQLESLPEDASVPVRTAPSGRGMAAPQAAAVPAGGHAPRTRAATFGLIMRVGLSVALGVGILFWPYEARCGAGLAMYLAAVGVVIVGGVWSTVWSWRHRSGRAHTLALGVLLWGLVLGSLEVLPRVGYANPTARHPATWACVAPHK